MNVDWTIFLAGMLTLLISCLVWRNNPKAKLNIFFGLFGLVTSVQIFFDFIFRFFPNLFVLRNSYAFAALIPLAMSFWIFEICNFHISKSYKLLFFFPGLLFFAITYMDGLIVKEIEGLSMLGYKGILGPLFPVYTLSLVFYVVFFITLLYRSQKKADPLKKKQLSYILAGILLYSFSAITFSLILPTFFGIYDFTLLDAPSFIFFVGFTAYAILKHHLFEVRVIATELFAIAICLILLVKFLLSTGFYDYLVNGGLLAVAGVFGVLLVRSVIHEVEQKNKIEAMAGDVKKAYEVEKKAKEELQRIDEAKSQFMMATQHHLRTPLTALKGYLSMTLEGDFGQINDTVKEKLGFCFESTNRLIKLVNEFLDISKLQLGRDILDIKETSIVEMLKDIIVEVKPEADKKGIYLTLTLPPEPAPLVMADAGKLREALYNLTDNAVKYTEKGGVKVELRFVKKGKNNCAMIIVTDTGIGMSKEEADEVFSRQFERGKEAKKVYALGRGIGLFITYSIIKAHKGKIWAESLGAGQGSAFYVELLVKP